MLPDNRELVCDVVNTYNHIIAPASQVTAVGRKREGVYRFGRGVDSTKKIVRWAQHHKATAGFVYNVSFLKA